MLNLTDRQGAFSTRDEAGARLTAQKSALRHTNKNTTGGKVATPLTGIARLA